MVPLPRFRPSGVADTPPTPESESAAADGFPDLLSYVDLERLFGRTERSLRQWIVRGHLEPVRIGQSVLFRREDVGRLLSGQLFRRVMARTVGGASTGVSRKSIILLEG